MRIQKHRYIKIETIKTQIETRKTYLMTRKLIGKRTINRLYKLALEIDVIPIEKKNRLP